MSSSPIILCADDYGISAGVNAGIEELARRQRISATTSLVTLPNWTRYASRLRELSNDIALGLHVNLTAGSPLGRMPNYARSGDFPSLKQALMRCFFTPPDQHEIAAEILRQLTHFEEHIGHEPDFIDGHQHVHVMPGIRRGLLQALNQRFPEGGILVRDPCDSVVSIVSRRASIGKALGVAVLSHGFGANLRSSRFITNHGFSGFSSYDRAQPFAREFANFVRNPGNRHIIMCHPGYPDQELALFDALVERRRDELDFLLHAPDLPGEIWHLAKRENGRPVWPR
jgi:chitin disaccharide deacetylase